MTKKEKAFMRAQADQHEAWAKQEIEAAKLSVDSEERSEHYRQADLHSCACNTIWNLLTDLEEV